MPQPTSILDALLDFKRAVVGQHIWHMKNRRRHICITCGCFRIEYQSKHNGEWKDV